MNREDAINALESLPEIEKISRAEIHPNDVIVVQCKHRVSMESADRMRVLLEKIWPDRKILVLDEGTELKVVQQ